MKKEITDKQVRCPRLGDEMFLSYCLKESGDLPCSRIVLCWSFCFDITALLKKTMSPEQWDKFINLRSNDKVISLIEIIEAAKAKK